MIHLRWLDHPFQDNKSDDSIEGTSYSSIQGTLFVCGSSRHKNPSDQIRLTRTRYIEYGAQMSSSLSPPPSSCYFLGKVTTFVLFATNGKTWPETNAESKLPRVNYEDSKSLEMTEDIGISPIDRYSQSNPFFFVLFCFSEPYIMREKCVCV